MLVACGSAPHPAAPSSRPLPVPELETSSPGAQGLDGRKLLELAQAVRDGDTPVFSILVSRHDRLVFELYTSSIDRDDAHYLMSVTKSVLSALVGIAVDRRLVPSEDVAVSEALPRALFGSERDAERFRSVTLRDVMGMSALDAPLWPQTVTPDSIDRLHRFEGSSDRVRFALAQPLLPSPGESFQYNDVTPMLAVAVLQCATGKSALDFAAEALFEPMGFRNYAWEGQDRAGFDNAGYGLRLRPIDMQKLGLLYLHHGAWRGSQLLSRRWADMSFTPWVRPSPGQPEPTYGSFWWTVHVAPGWTARTAQGWRGQKIAVFPEQDVVVTMTADIEDSSDDRVFGRILKEYVIPAVELAGDPAASSASTVDSELARVLAEVRTGPSRVRPGIEPRMIPSKAARERPRSFDVAACTTAR